MTCARRLIKASLFANSGSNANPAARAATISAKASKDSTPQQTNFGPEKMFLSFYSVLTAHRHEWLFGVSVICAAIVFSLFVHDIFFRIIARVRKTDPARSSLLSKISQRLRRPAQWIVILTAAFFA